MQGAGGIGGLLTQVDVGGLASYAYLYDANGNVGQLIDNADGSIDAHYEYDPYGNEILASGVAASDNPYRFSTKYFDGEFGLYYFGLRYLDPLLGRWLNYDPLSEPSFVLRLGQDSPYLSSELNKYGYVSNRAINSFDLLGLTGLDQVGVRIGQGIALAGSDGALPVVDILIGLYGIYQVDQWLDYQMNQFRTAISDNSILLFHGTDPCSAASLIGGSPLQQSVALEQKLLTAAGLPIGEPGFYMTPDYETALFFGSKRAFLHGEGFSVVGILFSLEAFLGTTSQDAAIRRVGGFPPHLARAFDHYEVVLFERAFPVFDKFRSKGKITVFDATAVRGFDPD